MNALQEVLIHRPSTHVYGCESCQELGTPGFKKRPIFFGLSDPKLVRRFIQDENYCQFCTCQTATNLITACMNRLNVNQQQVAQVQRIRNMRHEIDAAFRGWKYPDNMELYSVRSWVDAFGDEAEKQQAKQALLDMGKNGKIETKKGSWPGLLFWGEAGAGKTGGTVALCKKMDKEGSPSLFISLQDIILLMTFQDDNQMVERRRRVLTNVPVLAIDEFVHPGQNITDHQRTNIVFDIIDKRHKAMLPTLITTNCTLDELKEKLGTASYERLLTLCAPVWVGGKSGRQVVDSAY